MAEPYQSDIDFAFFAVNFGYTKADYEALTPREKVFIYKAWENKIVSDNTLLYNAVFTATYNVNRKKGKRALKLWRKAKVRRGNREIFEENLQIIKEAEKADGDSWVKAIYEANGMKMPERTVKDG